MKFTFNETANFVEVMKDLIKVTIREERPEPRWATLRAFDLTHKKASVVYDNEEDNPITVKVTDIRPLAVGARVLIDGLPGSRHIVEAPGGFSTSVFATENGMPSGGVAQSHSRINELFVDSVTTLESEDSWGTLVYLPRITDFTTVTYLSGGTIDFVGAHKWASVTDLVGNVLWVSADTGATAWLAGTFHSFSQPGLTTLDAGHYYFHIGYEASTEIKLVGKIQHAAMAEQAPYTGVVNHFTDTPPTIGSTLSTTALSTFAPYCYLS